MLVQGNNYHVNWTGTFYNTYKQTGMDERDLKWVSVSVKTWTTYLWLKPDKVVEIKTESQLIHSRNVSFLFPVLSLFRVVCFRATSVNFEMLLPWRAVGKINTRDEPGSRDFSDNARVKRNVTSEGEEKLCQQLQTCVLYLIILKCDTWGTNSMQTKYFSILRFFLNILKYMSVWAKAYFIFNLSSHNTSSRLFDVSSFSEHLFSTRWCC